MISFKKGTKKILLVLTFVIIKVFLFAQVSFTSQEEIDNFKIAFPGPTVLDAGIEIFDFYGIFDITNLDSLNELTYVDYIWFVNCNNLVSIDGLSNLDSIGFEIDISNCPNITSIETFNNITTLKRLVIEGTGISNLEGLNNLSSLKGSFSSNIRYNFSLIDISALSNLQIILGGG